MTLAEIQSLLDETRTDLVQSGHMPKAQPFPGQLPDTAVSPTGEPVESKGHLDPKKVTAQLGQPVHAAPPRLMGAATLIPRNK